MKANQLLLTVILASAIGAPIETLAVEKRVVQKMKRAAAHLRIEGELPFSAARRGDSTRSH